MRIDKAPCGNTFVNAWPREAVFINEHDKAILRNLAERVCTLAQSQESESKRVLWTQHNDLQTKQPVILIDMENGWNEALPWDVITCQGEMAQDWEMWLRKEIYWGETLCDDKPIDKCFYLPYFAVDTKWGIAEERVGGEDGGAYHWKSPWADMEEEFEELDVQSLIKMPEITVDWALSNQCMELAKQVFDGILDVQFRHRWFWSPDITLSYSNLRGMENMMCDFYDYPDKVHEIMRRLTDGHLKRLDALEAESLHMMNATNCYVASGGLGLTSQLNPTYGAVKLMDCWGFNEAQETSEVSPEMVKEFVLPYQTEIADRFGLNCYGCCEGQDKRFEYVKQYIPRLRRVSVSQWSDATRMAELLGGDYVYSYKCSPTDLAVPNINEEYIGKNLRKILDITSENGCCVELIMKDNHTLGQTPQNAARWVQICREELARKFG